MSIPGDPLDTPIHGDQQIDTPLDQPPSARLYQPDPLNHPPHTLYGDETIPDEVPARGLADGRRQVDGETDMAENVIPLLNALDRGSSIEFEVL